MPGSRCRRSTLIAVRDRAALAAARGAGRGARWTRRWSRSTAAPRPARWRRGEPPPAPSGAPSTALGLAGDGDAVTVSGGHVPQPTVLADVLEVIGTRRFRLLGRTNDLINVAGKRSSIGHLNYHLNAIDGVVDGAFWMPPESAATRTASCAWSPSSSRRGSANARDRSPRCASASTPPSCRAASSASTALPREADRQAAGRRGSPALARRAAAGGTPMSERVLRRRARDRRRPSGLRRPLPGPAAAAGRRRCWPRCSRRRAPSRRCAARVGAAPRLATVKFLAPVAPGRVARDPLRRRRANARLARRRGTGAPSPAARSRAPTLDWPPPMKREQPAPRRRPRGRGSASAATSGRCA